MHTSIVENVEHISLRCHRHGRVFMKSTSHPIRLTESTGSVPSPGTIGRDRYLTCALVPGPREAAIARLARGRRGRRAAGEASIDRMSPGAGERRAKALSPGLGSRFTADQPCRQTARPPRRREAAISRLSPPRPSCFDKPICRRTACPLNARLRGKKADFPARPHVSPCRASDQIRTAS